MVLRPILPARTILLSCCIMQTVCSSKPEAPEPEQAAQAPSPMPPLFVFQPTPNGCRWQVVPSLTEDPELLAMTEACPEDIQWSPDGKTAFVLGTDRIWTGPPNAHTAMSRPSNAQHMRAVNGEPALCGIDHQGTPQARTWRVENQRFVAGPTKKLSDVDFMMGDIWMSCPLPEADPGWTGLQQGLQNSPSSGGVFDDAPAALAKVVDAHGGVADTVGALTVGGQKLVYNVVLGDTWHATGPLVWCRDASCGNAVPFEDELPRQPALFPRGDYVLVAQDFDGKGAGIIRAGEANWALKLPADARAMWAPEGLEAR